jgi:hypothetical protein
MPFVFRRRIASALAVAALACWPLVAQLQPIPVDIVVLDKTGKAPDSLVPSDLSVTVGGRARSIAWVRRVSRGPGAVADAAARRAAGQAGTVYVAEPSRAIVMAVDEGSLPVGGERLAVQGAAALLDRLGVNDRVAVVRLPLVSGPTPALTTERPALRDAIGRIAGRLQPDDRARDGTPPAWRQIDGDVAGARRSGRDTDPSTPAVRADAPEGGAAAAEDGLDGLLRTLTALSRLPGRKAVAFFSAGLGDRAAGRIATIARTAADARASLYVFDLRAVGDRRAVAADANLLARLAQATGGVSIELGRNPAKDIEPLQPELDACFEIGIRRDDGDERAADRPLRVEARRAGLVVRAPSFVGLRVPASGDVEPPAPSVPAGQPRPPETYRGGGRVSPAPFPGPASDARNPEVDVVLAKLGDYAQGYVGQYSALVAEESYRQDVPLERREQRLRSDLLFVRSEPSQEWVSFRDVFEVDSRPVRDRDLRLEKLFLAPSPGASERLQAIKDESARYNIGPILRNINVPLYPLKILLPANVGRFEFALGQATAIDGVRVRPVTFAEVGRPTLARDPEGNDVPLQGRFLVEPATGAIVESTVSVELSAYSASIVVRYTRDAKLGLWVPAEMKERYWGIVQVGVMRQTETLMEGTARYSKFRRFQVSTEEKIVVPK